MTDGELDTFMRQWDSDGDGGINQSELVLWHFETQRIDSTHKHAMTLMEYEEMAEEIFNNCLGKGGGVRRDGREGGGEEGTREREKEEWGRNSSAREPNL